MIYNFITCSLVLIFGVLLAFFLGKKLKIKPLRAQLIYIWHTIFCFIYADFVLVNGGDAFSYYEVAANNVVEFNVGTAAVNWFTALFANYLEFSFIATSLVYNIVGFVGLLAFDASLNQVIINAKKNVRLVLSTLVFLPSISFWSSGIGKDAIAFMAIGLIVWAALAMNRRWSLMAFSIALIFIVRPHIAGLIVVALALATFSTQGRSSILRKFFKFGVLFAGVVIAVPYAMQYAGLGDAVNLSDLEAYFETRQGYNQEGAGGIDISQMNLPTQLFTYIFRPLPFEAHGFTALAASLENILLIIFFIYAGSCWISLPNKFSFGSGNILFLIIFSIMTWIILAMTTANLGISLRQKWMFLPMLIFVAVSAIAAAKPTRLK
jgi:hypothetical protein